MLFKKDKRKKIDEVFTPRASIVNREMYISRPDLEEKLIRAIQGSFHVIVHGDSGTGKSWLCKKVLSDLNAEFITINSALVQMNNSIAKTLELNLSENEKATKIEYTETVTAEANAVVAKGGINHTNKFIVGKKEPFEATLEFIRNKAKKRDACIVIENLEMIFEDSALMTELGNLIILLDDQKYADYKVKLIIIGVPAQIKEYFSKTKNLSSISNRVQEIPEVTKLNKEQVKSFVRAGFIDELKIEMNASLLDEYSSNIHWVTMGIPQRLHEYCLEIGSLCQKNNWVAENKFLIEAQKVWINDSLMHNYVVIEELMNSRSTAVGRRNQVLYALGKVESDEFRATLIEDIIRAEFPNSGSVTMNIGQILTEISNSKTPPIKRSVKGDSFIFVDPKFCICLRMMLQKLSNGVIEKVPVSALM